MRSRNKDVKTIFEKIKHVTEGFKVCLKIYEGVLSQISEHH